MKIWKYLLGLLTSTLLLLTIAVFQLPDSNFHIIACDVGQGDAILVTYKNIQILTDGGPDNKVLDCLSRHIPFWDKQIELVVMTHPDSDHSKGLIDVIKRYNIHQIVFKPVDSGTQVYKALENEVGSKGVRVIDPDSSIRLRLDLIYLDILHPTKGFENKKTNNHSIVSLLKYKEFEALLTGDIEDSVSDLVSGSWTNGSIEYIKVPHHGSKNGMSENLLKAFMPKVAVISVGKDNRYGHPYKEVLEMLEKYEVRIFRTDEMGDVEIVTDGVRYWIKKQN